MRVLAVITLALLSQACLAGSYVDGHYRKDGTYVQPHYRASPDEHRWNNPSSQTMGGNQRDEFSSRPQYNRSSPLYNSYGDQNRNGTPDSYE